MAHADDLDLPPFLDRRNKHTLGQEGACTIPLAPKTLSAVVDLLPMRTALANATTPAEVLAVDRQLEGLEAMMKAAGLYTDDQLREVREERCRARWALGRALERIERGHGPGRGKKMSGDQTSFRKVIEELSLDKSMALEAQRIGALPDVELEGVLAAARSRGEPVTFSELLIKARPYWHQASRQEKHRRIREKANARQQQAATGPFPLIYADPPWKFAVYSAKGLGGSPDNHYPTLTDDEIASFRVGGQTIDQIAHRNAALFLWCTSSNVNRAISIMSTWGFEFKTSAVWDKVRLGAGFVFRNRHELLLYGTRGAMPGPQYHPPSMFVVKRGRHSAKPPEVRRAIERMFPDFNASQKVRSPSKIVAAMYSEPRRHRYSAATTGRPSSDRCSAKTPGDGCITASGGNDPVRRTRPFSLSIN